MDILKNTILIFIICCSIKLYSQNLMSIKDSNEYKTYFYQNGNKSSEGFLVNGKPDKYWKTYFETGIIKSEGNRKNYELDSIWKFYNEEGSLMIEITYKNSKKNGIKRTFRKDGITEEFYVNDIKQGISKGFYLDGKIKYIIPFIKGKENGKAFEFTEDSLVISYSEYKNGFMIYKEKINCFNQKKEKDGKWIIFYKNGNIHFEETYKNGKKNGYFKEYSEEGSLLNIDKYIDGELQQNAKELIKLETKYDFYPSGNVKIEGTYADSIPEGIRRYFSEKGDVTSAKVYQEGIVVGDGIIDKTGKKQGAWKEYYFPSKETDNKRILKSEGAYKNDKKIGSWKFYFPDGKVEQIGIYNNFSQPIGDWKWYYPSGNIRKEESFNDGLLEGTMTEYNDSNTVISKGNYSAGLEEGFWFYNVGDEKQEGNYVAGKRSGLWKHFYDQKQLRFIGNFVDGVEDGKHRFYWDNGNMKEEGMYVMGKREGDWKIYNEDGTLFLTITYKDGIETKYNGVKVQTVNKK